MVQQNYEDQLYKMFANVNEWLKFAEAKNFGLLTFNAAVIIGISQLNIPDGFIWFMVKIMFNSFSAISGTCALISLFPTMAALEKSALAKEWISRFSSIISKETAFENIHFYGYLKTLTRVEFIPIFKTKTNSNQNLSGFEEELIDQILYNSRITWIKYQFFKIGTFFTLFGVIATLFSILVVQIIDLF